MWKVFSTKRFDRMLVSFVRAHPDLRSKVFTLIDSIKENPFNSRHKIHKLGGDLRDLYGISINFKYRITLKIEKNIITLISVGPHDVTY